MGLFFKLKRKKKSESFLKKSNVEQFEREQRKFLNYANAPKTNLTPEGQSIHCNVKLEATDHPDFGYCLEGKIESFNGDCLVSADGYFDIIHINGMPKFTPYEAGYAHYHITKQNPNGNFEFIVMLVSGSYGRCQVFTSKSDDSEVYNGFHSLPNDIKVILANHDMVLKQLNPECNFKKCTKPQMMDEEKQKI